MTMGRDERRRLTRAQRGEVWQRWRAGHTLEVISAALAVSRSGVYGEIQGRGGIAPGVPAPRGLSLAERRLLAQWRVGQRDGISRREAARRLGRAASTISREIHRNGARTATTRHYDPEVADRRAWHRARRPKPGVLATCPALRERVATQLALAWSPAQISAWLRVTYPDDPTCRVSAETIYRSLYVQARGVLKAELTAHLRRGRAQRRNQGRVGLARRGVLIDAVSIAARPADVADRAVPGHWEGDLLMGDRHSQIVTLVERASRYVVLLRVPSAASTPVVDALIAAARRLPAGMIRSLTWDRGSELAQHRRFTLATEIQVYFCDPHSPWQRGSNENTNGLLRQYFPKGQDVSAVTQEELDRVAHLLNTRPRQTLGWANPAVALSRLMRGVALTG